jgi:AraC-like DNA-binding protein
MFRKLPPGVFWLCIVQIWIILCSGFPSLSAAQSAPDSLQTLSLEVLLDKYSDNFQDKQLSALYARAIILNAKSKQDTVGLITGYHLMALANEDEVGIAYADSIISLTYHKSDSYYPATAFLIKGAVFYKQLNFKEALHNYLQANTFAEKHQNRDFIIRAQHSIASLKDRVGDFEDALSIKRNNYNYVLKNRAEVQDDDYLIYLFSLASSFNRMMQLDSSSYYNKLGIAESKALGKDNMYSLFLLNEGITKYRNLQYRKAFDSIQKSVTYLEGFNDKPNLAIAYYHLGKLYLGQGKDETAIEYLKKVDTIFQEIASLNPQTRETYELLINHYREKKDYKQQLRYVEQLLKLDSINNSNHIYISDNIVKEYDIPRLKAEKEMLVQKFNRDTRQYYYIIGVLLLLSLFIVGGLFYQYKRRQIYKLRFEKLLREKDAKNDSTPLVSEEQKKEQPRTLNVPEEIVLRILASLEEFEENKDFTALGLTLQILAKKFKTNAKYLSLVVNYYKQKNFSNYLNDLRIAYTIKRLKENPLFRKYTIQAIAKEVGFNNTESFSKAFYKKTGIKPSFFVKQLDKS